MPSNHRMPAAISRIASDWFPDKVAALGMQSSASSARRGDGRLWAVALGLSLLLNVGLLLGLGLRVAEIAAILARNHRRHAATPPAETMVMIFPEVAARRQSAPEDPAAHARQAAFVRTSEDQAAPPPEKPAFIGERDTRPPATGAPDPERPAPALPSGHRAARRDATFETTESRYQDGSLASIKRPTTARNPTPASPLRQPPSRNRAADNTTRETPDPGSDVKSSPAAAARDPAGRPESRGRPGPAETAPEKPKSNPPRRKTPKSRKPAPAPAEQPKPAVAKPSHDRSRLPRLPAQDRHRRLHLPHRPQRPRCGGLAARPLSGIHQPRRRAGVAAELRAPPRFHHARVSNRPLLRRDQRQGAHRPVRRQHGNRRGPKRLHPQLHPRRRHPRRCPPP